MQSMCKNDDVDEQKINFQIRIFCFCSKEPINWNHLLNDFKIRIVSFWDLLHTLIERNCWTIVLNLPKKKWFYLFSAMIGKIEKKNWWFLMSPKTTYIQRPYILNGRFLFVWYYKKSWCVIINLIQFSLSKHLTAMWRRKKNNR